MVHGRGDPRGVPAIQELTRLRLAVNAGEVGVASTATRSPNNYSPIHPPANQPSATVSHTDVGNPITWRASAVPSRK